MEPLMGQVMLFAGNFAPVGWMFCNGQLLSIAEYSALFSILGTTYGGDGQTTFALPNLSGRLAVSAGNGPGLPGWALGQTGGAESATMTTQNMPAHIHPVLAANQPGETTNPQGAVLAGFGTSLPPAGPYSSSAPDVSLSAQAVGAAGGSQPFSIIQPSLALNFIIAVEGIYPSPA
ncbi:tail fiber protein [Myxococcota bacterium]|nr:tail fiber protein [Myxococcota bacterium]